MDPVGPWSYAYNRLTGVQAPSGSTPTSGDFHHHLALAAAANAIGGMGASSGNASNNAISAHHPSAGLHPSAATTQLLLQSGFSSNFLSSAQPASTPANIAYETVFSPFLHATTAAASHSNPKPAHYNNLQPTLPRSRTEVYQQQSSPSPSQHQQISNLSQQQTSQQSPQNTRR